MEAIYLITILSNDRVCISRTHFILISRHKVAKIKNERNLLLLLLLLFKKKHYQDQMEDKEQEQKSLFQTQGRETQKTKHTKKKNAVC